MQEMFQVFKKNSYGTNAAIIEFAKQAGVDVNTYFKEGAEEALDEIKALKPKIDVALERGDTGEVERLRQQMAAVEAKRMRLQGIQGKNAVYQGADLALISDKTPKILAAIIKGMTGIKNYSELNAETNAKAYEKMIVAMESLEKQGFSKDQVRYAIELQQQSENYLQNIFGTSAADAKSNKGFLGKLVKLTEEQKSSLVFILKRLADAKTTEEQTSIMAESKDKIAAMLDNDLGMAEGVLKASAASATFGRDLIKIIESGGGDLRAQVKELLTTYEVGQKVVEYNQANNEIANAEAEKNAGKTLDELVNSTTSMEDMKKIMTDGASYYAASLPFLKGTYAGVTSIARSLANHWGGGKTEDEKAIFGKLESYKTARTWGRDRGMVDLNNTESITEKNLGQAYLWALKKRGSYTDKTDQKEITQNEEVISLIGNLMEGNVAIEDAVLKVASNTGQMELIKGKDSYIPPQRQGLRTPEMVTHPGAVVLHPRETILPSSYMGFKAKPLGGQAKSGGVASSPSKNFNINVYATEANMGQKIANEIRAVMYKEYA
jgi:hypothetical protein